MPRVSVLCCLLVLAASPVLAQSGEQRIDRKIAMDPDASIRIHNMTGSIRIEAWNRDTLAVSGTVSDAGSNRFFMGGTRRGAKLGIEGPLDIDQAPAHLFIRVPARAKVWVKSASANIYLTGLRGGIDAFSTGGTIRFDGEPDQLNLETMDGNIEVTAGGTWIRAKTASGLITIRGAGEDVAASTVSGGINMLGAGMRRARLESVTGSLSFSGWLTRDGSLTAESHSGTIDILLPSDTRGEFGLSTYHGTIRNDFRPYQAQPGRTGAEQGFTIGEGGGVEIEVKSFKGNIILRMK
jgi:Putative adhesin